MINTDNILSIRQEISDYLPTLYQQLQESFIFSKEETESNTDCIATKDGVFLSSSIDLHIENIQAIQSLSNMSQALSHLKGKTSPYQLGKHSLLIFQPTFTVQLELILNVPILFSTFYIQLPFIYKGKNLRNEDVYDPILDIFLIKDEYFEVLLKHGLLSYTKGVISVIDKQEIDNEEKPVSLYSNLYEE